MSIANTRQILNPDQVLYLVETIGTSAATLLEFLRQDHDSPQTAIDMAQLAVASIGALADEATNIQMAGTVADWFSGPHFREIGREAHDIRS